VSRLRRAAALAALLSCLAPAMSAQTTFKGRPLTDALSMLRRQGLNLIFSSDLVRPEMTVEVEPAGATLQELLETLLAPHGLTAEIGPGGSLLVVERTTQPIIVSITSPTSRRTAIGTVKMSATLVSPEPVEWVEFLVDGRQHGLRRAPPYEIEVDIGTDNVVHEFEIVAYGRFGAEGRASVKTQRYVVEGRVEVALRQLPITVTLGGFAVDNLEADDFVLEDEGRREPIVTLAQADLPIRAVLLIDASESMKGQGLRAALDGVRAFLSRLGPEDTASVLLFSDRTLAVTPFSSDEQALLARIEGASAGGATALNDYLFAALEILRGIDGRPIVVLLSDGADVVSVLGIDDVRWKIKRSDALIYWIRLPGLVGLGSRFSSSWRNVDQNRREARGLEAAVRDGGGRIEDIEGIGTIEVAFDAIIEELRRQYVVGYYPSEPRYDGSWRKVEVRVRRPGARVRYRNGYFDQ